MVRSPARHRAAMEGLASSYFGFIARIIILGKRRRSWITTCTYSVYDPVDRVNKATLLFY